VTVSLNRSLRRDKADLVERSDRIDQVRWQTYDDGVQHPQLFAYMNAIPVQEGVQLSTRLPTELDDDIYVAAT
jgi:hypothetical protein